MNRRFFSLGLAIALTCLPGAARAEEHDAAAAEALFREGRKAVEAGDYRSACPRFAESYRLDSAPGTLFNLADCEEHLSRTASAWEHFSRVTQVLPASDPRHPYAKKHVAELEKRVPHLAIVLAPGAPHGTKVTRDGVELGAASFGVALPVNPGDHVLVVKAPGHGDRTETVKLAEGQSRQVTATPGAALPGSTATPPSTATPDATAPPPAPGGHRTLGLVAAGVGVVAIGAGALFGLSALSKKGDSDQVCSGGSCSTQGGVASFDDAKSEARIADVCFGVGLLGLAVGSYLILTAGGAAPAPAPSSALRIVPAAGRGGAGVAIGGGW